MIHHCVPQKVLTSTHKVDECTPLVSELAALRGGGETVVCLTDPETAHSFVAVVVLETEAAISSAELRRCGGRD